MPVTNEKTVVWLNETAVTGGVNLTSIQSGNELDKTDGSNPDAQVGINQEVIRAHVADHVDIVGNANLGFAVGSSTVKWQETSGIEGGVNPDDQSFTSYVSKSNTSPSDRILMGFDVGPDFRFGRFSINPHVGYSHEQYLSSKAEFPVANLAGSTQVVAGNYFTLGARAAYQFSDHVAVGVDVTHGFGTTAVNLFDSDGEQIAGHHSYNSGTTAITAGPTFIWGNKDVGHKEPVITGRKAAEAQAQEIHTEIMNEVGDDLIACGYADVRVNVYDSEHFDGSHLSPVPGVTGWYYNIEPLIADANGVLGSVGGESNSSPALDGTSEFTSKENFIKWIKAQHDAGAHAAAEPAADAPVVVDGDAVQPANP